MNLEMMRCETYFIKTTDNCPHGTVQHLPVIVRVDVALYLCVTGNIKLIPLPPCVSLHLPQLTWNPKSLVPRCTPHPVFSKLFMGAHRLVLNNLLLLPSVSP